VRFLYVCDVVVRKNGCPGGAGWGGAVTVFDLLVIVLFFTAIGTLIAAAVLTVRGRGARALGLLRKLAVCTLVYIGIVYAATALSKEIALHVGEPECDDDWCITVENAKRTPIKAITRYDVTLRIFSRARRVAQREMGARDVYLVDSEWRRYDPVRTGAEVALNTLLQPGESVITSRCFEVPADVRGIGLMVDRPSILPVCLVIGECGAFHKGTIVRME
jgi:hypothetical protein